MKNKNQGKFNILVLEGFILLLVILLHTSAPKILVSIFSYGVPVLFFVRGYQWRDRSIKELMLARLQLIKTYYFVGILGTILYVFLSPKQFINYPKHKYFINLFLANVNRGDEIAIIIAPIWFLMTLFVADIMYQILRKREEFVIAGIFASILFKFIGIGPLFFRISTAFFGIPFIELGRLWKEKKIKINYYILVLSILILAIVVYLNNEISWYTHNFGKVHLALLGELSGIVISVFIGYLLTNSASLIREFLQKIAINALFIFSYHGIIGVLLAFLYLPFLKIFGFNDVLAFVSKFWYIHFILTVTVLILLLQCIPSKIRRLLIGDMRFLAKNKEKN